MDVACPRCGEPWDTDSFNEAYDEDLGEPISYDVARKNFPRLGCGAMTGTKTVCAVDPTSTVALIAQAAMGCSEWPDDWASDIDDLRYVEGV
jgi:hypothetical protein